MITAIGLGFLGILLSVLGMKCTSVGASNHKAKARTALLGGLLLGVAGKKEYDFRCLLLVNYFSLRAGVIWCFKC